MTREIILDAEDSSEAPVPPKRGRFGDFGGRNKITCAGFAGETCKRAGTLKGGKLWYCAYHAPRGSEG